MGFYRRANNWLADSITRGVASMTCAYIFAILALTALPGAVHDTASQHSLLPLVEWLSQSFLQLVLLSVIMVGSRSQQSRLDALHDKHDALHAKIDALD